MRIGRLCICCGIILIFMRRFKSFAFTFTSGFDAGFIFGIHHVKECPRFAGICSYLVDKACRLVV